jgi:uncharacterized protein YabN with tetrapyrrole methylase and pyrophosphatase domain
VTKRPSLTIVGTGFLVAGQVTPESWSAIQVSDRFFFIVGEPATRLWLEQQHPRAESLHDVFWDGRPRQPAYDEIVARILAPLHQGLDVCAAFYGHAGVFVYSSHEAIRQARAAGFTASMLPAVSAEDCLFADLEIDPARDGCQSFEATDFLARKRAFDPRSGLVLWQIGALGVVHYYHRDLWNRDGLDYLVEVLRRSYPADHPVVVYEHMQLPVCPPLIQRTALAALPRCTINTHSTLWVPPVAKAPVDEAMLARIRTSSLHRLYAEAV